MKYLLSAALCVAALSACTDREAQRQAQATAQAQARKPRPMRSPSNTTKR